ncbi:MAG: hypothetical protein JWO26_1880 [Rhodospirillales bacterium]|nr:hypothetical protein [Rhodospirillales bacterium]
MALVLSAPPSTTRRASGDAKPFAKIKNQQMEVQDRHDPGGVQGAEPLTLLPHDGAGQFVLVLRAVE